MITVHPNNVTWAKASIVDEVGKVFFYRGRVFRAIFSKEYAQRFMEFLSNPWIGELFEMGLVRTIKADDILLEGSHLTLEHERIPFELHPAECTSYMHWLSAKTLLNLCGALSERGYIIKDAHPWNIMFKKGYPKFIDFGSITKSMKITDGWLEEFRKYFGVPIWLAAGKFNVLALEYRREHSRGFGLKLLGSKLAKNIIPRGLTPPGKAFSTPKYFFQHISEWLENHKPKTRAKGNWAGYQQCGNSLDPFMPELPKPKFVYEILSKERPNRVLDFAANKGYYSKIAAMLGAAVIACDYEEYCVNECLHVAQVNGLNITPALLDFKAPTPNYGMGLRGPDSFERMRSDIVLALGLVHHICIAQQIPMEIFCDICMSYAEKGILLEYVGPTDIHVKSWGVVIPKDYSLDNFSRIIGNKFPKIIQGKPITDEGLNRAMLYFSK